MPQQIAQLSPYTDWLRASGASPSTIKIRTLYLTHLAAQHNQPLLTLDTQQLLAFMARDGWKPETRKVVRASIRSFYKWAVEFEHLTIDPSKKLPTVRIPIGKPHPTPEATFARALLAADRRDTLLLLFAGYAGLRRAEIAQVHTDDIVDGELRVCGKGGRVRTIPLHPRLLTALDDVDPGYLFPGQSGGHLTAGHVGDVISGLLGPGWAAHSLRHRFASRAYLAERDILAIQSLLGHSKPETTARYTKVPEDATRAAVMAIG